METKTNKWTTTNNNIWPPPLPLLPLTLTPVCYSLFFQTLSNLIITMFIFYFWFCPYSSSFFSAHKNVIFFVLFKALFIHGFCKFVWIGIWVIFSFFLIGFWCACWLQSLSGQWGLRSALDKSDRTGDYEYDPTGVILEPAHFTKVHTGNPDILNYFEHLFVTFCIFFFPSFFFF